MYIIMNKNRFYPVSLAEQKKDSTVYYAPSGGKRTTGDICTTHTILGWAQYQKCRNRRLCGAGPVYQTPNTKISGLIENAWGGRGSVQNVLERRSGPPRS